MSILESFVDVFAPHICLGCGAEGSVLCKECVQTVPLHPEVCWRCHRLSTGFKACPSCRRYAPLGHVTIAGLYEGLAQAAIHALKFERSVGAAKPLAGLLWDRVPHRAYDLIVPIPAATSRYRQRGYNPAACLAQQIAQKSGASYIEALGRLGQKRQVGAKRADRLEQLKDAYYVVHARSVRGAEVLLVDDVITTGATLAEAARTLKAAGARRIDAAVLARHH